MARKLSLYFIILFPLYHLLFFLGCTNTLLYDLFTSTYYALQNLIHLVSSLVLRASNAQDGTISLVESGAHSYQGGRRHISAIDDVEIVCSL